MDKVTNDSDRVELIKQRNRQQKSVQLKGFNFSDIGVSEDGTVEEVTIHQKVIVDVKDLELKQVSLLGDVKDEDMWKLYERLYSPEGVMDNVVYMEEPECKFYEELVKYNFHNNVREVNGHTLRVNSTVDEIFQQVHKLERVCKNRLDKVDARMEHLEDCIVHRNSNHKE